jgi:hypothetical protein
MTNEEAFGQEHEEPCYVISVAARPRNARPLGGRVAGQQVLDSTSASIAPASSVSFQSTETTNER